VPVAGEQPEKQYGKYKDDRRDHDGHQYVKTRSARV